MTLLLILWRSLPSTWLFMQGSPPSLPPFLEAICPYLHRYPCLNWAISEEIHKSIRRGGTGVEDTPFWKRPLQFFDLSLCPWLKITDEDEASTGNSTFRSTHSKVKTKTHGWKFPIFFSWSSLEIPPHFLLTPEIFFQIAQEIQFFFFCGLTRPLIS